MEASHVSDIIKTYMKAHIVTWASASHCQQELTKEMWWWQKTRLHHPAELENSDLNNLLGQQKLPICSSDFSKSFHLYRKYRYSNLLRAAANYDEKKFKTALRRYPLTSEKDKCKFPLFDILMFFFVEGK